jgi:hypothetical protein
MTSASNENDNNNIINKVQLLHEVLIKNDETMQVDPLLLVVPLSIIHKPSLTTTTGTSKINTKVPKKSHIQKSFQHNFPTQNEILTNSDTSKLATKYSLQLLSKLQKSQINNDGVSEKLLDIHLLMYLQELLDRDTMKNIATVCAGMSSSSSSSSEGKSVKLASKSVMALQMLYSSLTVSDSNESEEL